MTAPQRTRAATAEPGNLPAHRLPLVGREKDIEDVRQCLETAPRGLLTLTGTGGVGKTCLAMAVAAGLENNYPGGVWLVEMAAVTQPLLVFKAVAAALGLRERASPLIDTLLEYLASRTVLLVLDNCEHQVDACADLSDRVLSHCAGVRILATSREPLRIAGEVTWRVPSLAIVDPLQLPGSVDEVGRCPAIRLFVERARAVRRDFTLTPRNAPAAAQICARLDGIPLAIELAAARVQVLSVEQIVERLDDMFHLLVGGSRTVPTRQQTLRGALDWSYGLLTADERCLLRRLAVFASGFDVRAAEAICSGDDIEAPSVMDLLNRLVDKSLVVGYEDGEEVRYRLLEPIRQYAAERLAASGEQNVSQSKHAQWFLAVAEEGDRALRGPEQIVWSDRLEREHDNLRAAQSWCLAAADCETGLRLGTALWLFWRLRGHRQEGSRWLEEVLARSDGVVSECRAAALQWSAELAYILGSYEHARIRFDQSLRLWRGLGSTRGIARTLCHLGRLLGQMGDFDGAMRLLDESVVLSRNTGDLWTAGFALMFIASELRLTGKLDRAEAAGRESVAIYEQEGDEHLRAHVLQALGDVALDSGDMATGASLLEDSLAAVRHVACNEGIAAACFGLARLAQVRGDLSRATRLCADALRLQHELELRAEVLGSLQLMASLIVARGDAQLAARLIGAADALREAIGLAVRPVEAPVLEKVRADVRAALGYPAFVAACQQGRRTPLDAIIDDACATASSASQQTMKDNTCLLTPRERQVAALIARGYTNRGLADVLVISERTADGHVSSILAKLGAHTRAQVAVWAVSHGLAESHRSV